MTDYETTRKRKCEAGILITCPIVFGSAAIHLGKKSDESATHRWKLYIRGPNNEDLASFVQKVAFTLHPSFAEPVREVLSPPFEVTEVGWGEFEASIRVYFRDQTEAPVDLFHLIKLYPLGPPQPTGTLKKIATVVSEQYEEIVFCNPGERFRRQLMTYVVKDVTGQTMLSPDGSTLVGPVFDDSLDIERLGGIQQHINADIEAAKVRLMQLQALVLEATQMSRSLTKQSGADGMTYTTDNIVGTGVIKSRSTFSAGGMQQLPSPRGGSNSSARPTVSATSTGTSAGNQTQKRSRPSTAKKPMQQGSPQMPQTQQQPIQTQQCVSVGPSGAVSNAH